MKEIHQNITLPFWINFYNIVKEPSKTNSTKPHENSVTLTTITFEIRWKNSMKNNSHFASVVTGKIIFSPVWFFFTVAPCIAVIIFLTTQGMMLSGRLVLVLLQPLFELRTLLISFLAAIQRIIKVSLYNCAILDKPGKRIILTKYY